MFLWTPSSRGRWVLSGAGGHVGVAPRQGWAEGHCASAPLCACSCSDGTQFAKQQGGCAAGACCKRSCMRCLALPPPYCCWLTTTSCFPPTSLQGLGKALVEGMTRTLLRREITNITLFADANGECRQGLEVCLPREGQAAGGRHAGRRKSVNGWAQASCTLRCRTAAVCCCHSAAGGQEGVLHSLVCHRRQCTPCLQSSLPSRPLSSPSLLSSAPHIAVVNFYTGLGYAADPEGIKGMFWHPRY